MLRPIALRTFLIGALLALLLPIVMASGWVYYRSAQHATEEFAQQIADEVSGRVREKIITFFDVPRRVVDFNVAQARAGYLRWGDQEELMRQFLLQIRQQPELSFVSMGLTDGQYFAGSRPPLGEEKDLRMLRARITDQRHMEVFRVNDANQRGASLSRSNAHYDARNRPWYKSALWNGGTSWYAPYRYQINDVQGAYADMGMGVSAPVFNEKGTWIGVVTADVALSQVSNFLKSVSKESGGVAFLADSGGELLATSTSESSFHTDTHKNDYRVKTAESLNPILRTVGEVIRDSAKVEGTRYIDVKGERHLARWWTHQLNHGPELTLGVVLPESQFNTPMRGVLRNVVYLTLAVMLASVFFAFFVANRMVEPLALLSAWAARLTTGDLTATAPKTSPIRELISLSEAMGYMARHLQKDAENLSHEVAQRTAELEYALAVIAQALTDERQFIAMLSHEVRSPLAAIDTAAQLLSFRLKDHPPQLLVIERIRRGTTRLSTFFDNCLTQDRIDSHHFALQASEIDVERMVSWVVESSSQLSTGHVVNVTTAPALPTLVGDEVLLRIALTNLLSNAFKYSPAGSTVDVRVWQDDAQCSFEVRDYGTGIPAEEAAVIFHKYRRGRAAEGKPGAGLGLALVDRIATLHGGQVRMKSKAGEEGQGTRFILTVPFQQPPAVITPS